MVSYEDLKSAVATQIPIKDAQQRVTQIAVDRLSGHHVLPPLRAIHACAEVWDVLRLLEQWALLSNDKVDILATFCDNFVNSSPLLIDAFNSYKLSSLRGTSRCNSVSTAMASSSDYNLSASSSAHFCSSGDAVAVSLRHCPCSTLPSVAALFPQPASSSSQPPSASSSHRTSQYEDLPPEVMQVTDYLSKELGKRWLDVGRQLPGMVRTTRDINDDYSIRHTSHKITALLEQHFLEGGAGGMPALLQALSACDLNKQRDHVLQLLRQHTVGGLRESCCQLP